MTPQYKLVGSLVATNKTLEEEVAAGRFREDLYYRLNVLSIPLPALRARGGDLPLLMHHFLEQSAIQNGKGTLHVSPQAMRVLLDYGYPGNIRELENIIQHAVTMAEDDTIRLGDLPQHLQQLSKRLSGAGGPGAPDQSVSTQSSLDFFHKGVSLDAELEEYERRILRAALDQSGGVQKRAAEALEGV